ncbi:MAG: ankyrin repeat domain-containing protein [Micavibrio sp.]|nr:ankyrin repeat domain-containing protein [Micavibrio sp.]
MKLFKTKQEKLDLRAFEACRNKNYARLFRAIEDGANPNFETAGNSLLYRAAWHGFTEGVMLLLERGADPNFRRSGSDNTALHEAANDGSFDIARALIEKGADVNALRGDNRWSPLHCAANNGRTELVRLLMANGANTGAPEEHMNTPADLADKNHPRLADLIRGTKSEPVAVADGAEGWHLTASDEVSSISQKTAIGYKLTEIFNFGAGIYTRIARNLDTGAESQSVKFFDEFSNRAALDAAKAALLELGGQVAADAGALDKPALRPQFFKPGQGA